MQAENGSDAKGRKKSGQMTQMAENRKFGQNF
jgi:hypothetical protein